MNWAGGQLWGLIFGLFVAEEIAECLRLSSTILRIFSSQEEFRHETFALQPSNLVIKLLIFVLNLITQTHTAVIPPKPSIKLFPSGKFFPVNILAVFVNFIDVRMKKGG
jgi:hypothetical protein